MIPKITHASEMEIWGLLIALSGNDASQYEALKKVDTKELFGILQERNKQAAKSVKTED